MEGWTFWSIWNLILYTQQQQHRSRWVDHPHFHAGYALFSFVPATQNIYPYLVCEVYSNTTLSTAKEASKQTNKRESCKKTKNKKKAEKAAIIICHESVPTTTSKNMISFRVEMTDLCAFIRYVFGQFSEFVALGFFRCLQVRLYVVRPLTSNVSWNKWNYQHLFCWDYRLFHHNEWQIELPKLVCSRSAVIYKNGSKLYLKLLFLAVFVTNLGTNTVQNLHALLQCNHRH